MSPIKQDISHLIGISAPLAALSPHDDLSWTAESLHIFQGLTFVGPALTPLGSWWYNALKKQAFCLRNIQITDKTPLLYDLPLQAYPHTSYTHILCHLHHYEQKQGGY